MAKYRIHVKVYDINGNPVPRALVTITKTTNVVPLIFPRPNYYSSVGVSWGYTNAFGEFISFPLDPGQYRISVQIKAGGTIEQSVVQLTDRDVTVPIRFKPISPGLVTQPGQPITLPGILHLDGTTQTGALTSDKNFWLGLAIGGALLYLLLRR